MNMMVDILMPPAREDLLRQAEVCRALGSPFVARVLEAGFRQLPAAPLTMALFAGWSGDPAASALAMRFNAALHALARQGTIPLLSALYRREHDDFDTAIATALAAHDDAVADWIRHPTQTNEVGRAGALVAALLVARQETGCDSFELLEIGSSCGLNLNLGRYAYRLGGQRAGSARSAVEIAPEWHGDPPPAGAFAIVAARGVDLSPLDVADAATRERLMAFVWADQPARAARLERALAIAQSHPPRIDRANAAQWLAQVLDRPQPAGVCRVILHSMVFQYLAPEDRETVEQSIVDAGSRATATAPLARIGFEWTEDRCEVQLRLRCWPGPADPRVLAVCHPYGDRIDWRA